VSFNKESHLQVAFDTGEKEYKTVKRKDEFGVAVDDVEIKSIIAHYTYHTFYPVFLKNIEEQKTEIRLDTIIPCSDSILS
jgi:hypothetical protein